MAKYLGLVGGRPTQIDPNDTSAGVADAGKIIKLNGAGQIDPTLLPNGVMADAVTMVASEALSAGDFVNVYSNAGTANVRKAIATSDAMRAHAYVLAAVISGGTATVYYDDNNSQQSGMTPGPQWLSATTAGRTSSTPPSTTGQIAQEVGVASSATSVHVRFGEAYTL